MKRFIEGLDRRPPSCRTASTTVKMLDLAELDFAIEPDATGRPGYHPATMLKLYVYGYLNQVQSSRRLERECGRNLELIWLMGRLKPDFKAIADFRRDNGPAIRKVCRQFVALCRHIDLLDASLVAIDGSKFKAVNAKARSYTRENSGGVLVRSTQRSNGIWASLIVPTRFWKRLACTRRGCRASSRSLRTTARKHARCAPSRSAWTQPARRKCR